MDGRAKSLIVDWIPHCIDEINRTQLSGQGGIDNFVEAAKKLRGEPAATTGLCLLPTPGSIKPWNPSAIALMVDPQGDPEIIAAQDKMAPRWKIGFRKSSPPRNRTATCRTAYTLGTGGDNGRDVVMGPAQRGNHEGYTAGYFIESAINHYTLTEGKDAGFTTPPRNWPIAGWPTSAPAKRMVRRPPGNGAGARALWPFCKRHGRRRTR